MSKFVKFSIIIIFSAFALSLAIPYFVSLDSYKGIIATEVTKATGRDFFIGGQINLAIFPNPQLKLEQVKLSSLPGAKASSLVEVEKVSVSVELLPLLSGKLVVRYITLDKPQINLEKLKDGKTTWDFTNAMKPKKESSAGSYEASAKSDRFYIENIKINKGAIEYIEGSNKKSIKDIDADLRMAEFDKPIDFTANFRMFEQNFNLKGNATLGDKPKISLTSEIATLNLDMLDSGSTISHDSKKTSNIQQNQSQGRWSHAKIDLSILKIADGDCDISIKKLIKGSLVLENLKAKLHLADGVLKVSNLTTGLYGGELDASGSAINSNGMITIKARAKNLALKNIAPTEGKIKITEGIVNLDVNLKTIGENQYQYANNLLGNVSLDSINGRVSGINLSKIINSLNSVKNLDGVLSALNSSFLEGETEFKNFESMAVVENGVAQITKCTLSADGANIKANGKLDLPKYWMDIIATLIVDVKNIPPFNVRIYGALDSLQHKLDTASLQKYLLKNVLGNVVDTIKSGKPQDIIKNVIGGFKGKKLPKEDANPESTSSEVKQPEDQAEQERPDEVNQLIQKGIKGLFKK